MEYRREKGILNGKIKLITGLTEFRMSLWVTNFGLENTLTGEEIIPVIASFNLDDFEEIDNLIKIKFRIYPNGSEYYEIEVDPFLKRFKYKSEVYDTKDFYKMFA